MTDPIDFRDRLASAVTPQLDAETIQWLCTGFQRHRNRGMSLNAALRLDKASLRRVRDVALREAAELLRPGAESEWQVAVRLADAISRFETRIWSRCRTGTDVPYLGPMDLALYRAFRQGVKVPSTPKMLYQLVQKQTY